MIKEHLSAHYVYHNQQLLKRAVVQLDANRMVTDVIGFGGKVVELPAMRFLNGILFPIKHITPEVLAEIRLLARHFVRTSQNLSVVEFFKFIQPQLDVIAISKTVDFALLKKVNYQTMELNDDVVIVPVKWFF